MTLREDRARYPDPPRSRQRPRFHSQLIRRQSAGLAPGCLAA
jgi:hypothetical protein